MDGDGLLAVTLPEDDDPLEIVEGVIERVVHHNEDDGFFVAAIKLSESRRATVVGRYPFLKQGELLRCIGRWEHDRSHGRQFKADQVRTSAPRDLDALLKYLSSGAVKGLGKKSASNVVRVYGQKTPEALLDPERLMLLPKIGEKTAHKIATSWADLEASRDIMTYLVGHGLGAARSMKVYKKFGTETVQRIEENPYILSTEVRGIGFLIADRIADSIGIPQDSLVRVRAGVCHVLDEARAKGHCGLTEGRLIREACRTLSVRADLVRQAVDLEVLAANLVRDTCRGEPALFLARMHRAENTIAARLKKLRDGALPWRIDDVAAEIARTESELGTGEAPFTLGEDQRRAMGMALTNKVSIVTGNPGTGKTSMMVSVLSCLKRTRIRMALAAPTGKAAKRLSQSTGIDAVTIHRLLEVDGSTGGFRRNEKNPLDIDLVVVDEASMIDVLLMASLTRALPDHAALILVGDIDQLPSVGAGQVLGDMIESRAIAVTRLTKIFRQAEASLIIQNAHRFNRGEPPVLPAAGETADFYYINCDKADVARDKIIGLVTERIPGHFGFDPKRDIQVLSPMKNGDAGTKAINAALQAHMTDPAAPSVERYGERFTIGDRVIQMVNNYEKDVYNGDTGQITALDPDDQTVAIQFDEGREVTYDFDALDEVRLAYAMTIHKSQGSEYPVVIIPLLMAHYTMLQRNLIYTGVTRGKKLVIVIGQPQALQMALRNCQTAKRTTRLAQLLSSEMAMGDLFH